MAASLAPLPHPTRERKPLKRLVWIAAALLFLLHAANYAYFFIDDEGIPFVTAQNVLDGHGFVYNPQDGPVEAYTDFLHVWVEVALLALVRGVGLNKIAVFFVGKALSLVFAIGVIWLMARLLKRLGLDRGAPFVGALGFLVLAGPLAVWSMSSLETTEFAFLVACLVYLLCDDRPNRRSDVLSATVASAVVLDRIDGFVYAGAIVTAMWISAPAPRRSELFRRVVAPLVIVFAAYHTWRVVHYHDVLPPAVWSKVLFKFERSQLLVTRLQKKAYAVRFFDLFAWIPVIATGLTLVLGRRDHRVLGLAVITMLVTLYVSVVEDWMFGFRFFAAVLPLFGVMIAWSLARIRQWHHQAAWAVAACSLAAFSLAAIRFERSYEESMRRPTWLRQPHFGIEAYFPTAYYELQRRLRALATPGDTLATNLGGFLPFMTGMPNVDNLGLCTRFFAELPTSDVIFTEVGRYSAMTGKPVLRAADAYLMYRAPTFIVEPHNWITGANNGDTPRQIFGGRYELLPREVDEMPDIYVRRAPLDEFRTRPDLFFENLVHISSVLGVRVDGRPAPPSRYLADYPFLYEETGPVSFRGGVDLEVHFARQNVPVYELYIDRVATSAPARVTISLGSTSGSVYQETFDVVPGRPISWLRRLRGPIGATRASLQFTAPTDAPTTITLSDVRVQGQRPALARFIERTLTPTPRPRTGLSFF